MASFLAKIIRSLKTQHPMIDNIDFFSDGATSQIKCSASRCPMGKVSLKALEVPRSMLSPKLSGLVMMHWILKTKMHTSSTLELTAGNLQYITLDDWNNILESEYTTPTVKRGCIRKPI